MPFHSDIMFNQEAATNATKIAGAALVAFLMGRVFVKAKRPATR